MATERVTRNRTDLEPLETVSEPEPFGTGSELAQTTEQWNRREKIAGTVKPPEKTA